MTASAIWRNFLAWMKPEDAEAPVRPVSLRAVLALAGVFLVAWMVMGSIQFSQHGLVGADGHYHVRLAEIMSERGPLTRFEWTQTSVHRERFMDKDFLFHVLLIPFVGEDLRLGPKLLTTTLAALLWLLIAWFAYRQGFPAFWLAALFLLAAGIQFNFRMSLTRPHLLSVLLAVMAGYLLLRRNGWGLLAVGILFPLSYTALHLLPVLTIIYGVARLLHGKRFAWRELGLILLGTALGILLHPNRANLLYHWWLQNVEVLANAWRLAPLMGVEFHAPSGRALVWDSGLLFFGLFGTCLLTMLSGVRHSLRSTFLFLASVGFLVMFLSVSRLVEYWAPFSVLFFFSAAADWRQAGQGLGAWLKRYGRLAGLTLIGLALVLSFQSMRSLLATQTKVAVEKEQGRVFDYAAGGRYLARHAAAGDQVFTCGWDTFVFLFYYAPQARYLVHLDPTFMLAYDEDLFSTWLEIGQGLRDDAWTRIEDDFKARWIFIERQARYDGFLQQAGRSSEVIEVFSGPQSSIFVFSPFGRLPWQIMRLSAGLLAPVCAVAASGGLGA